MFKSFSYFLEVDCHLMVSRICETFFRGGCCIHRFTFLNRTSHHTPPEASFTVGMLHRGHAAKSSRIGKLVAMFSRTGWRGGGPRRLAGLQLRPHGQICNTSLVNEQVCSKVLAAGQACSMQRKPHDNGSLQQSLRTRLRWHFETFQIES